MKLLVWAFLGFLALMIIAGIVMSLGSIDPLNSLSVSALVIAIFGGLFLFLR